MCGICGELFFNGTTVSQHAVKTMMDRMETRGPDSHGIHHAGTSVFGHRRLKIIDLSRASNQPMEDKELGLSIVFNGAIYNYKDLRRTLSQKGYRFFSNGDTEVILKAFHAWGEDCVDHLNGMFAFAVHNRETGSVFLARDRLGIKPLYLADTGNSLRFASSLPALLATPGIDGSINPKALHHYMTFHSVVPAPDTIINGIRKLEPGCHLTVSESGRQTKHPYWKLPFYRNNTENRYTFRDWKEMLVEKLKTSVKRRLVADVPVGVLLSGGVDSSLVVGLLARAGQEDLKTFSIGFESVGGEKGDEFEYSDIIADRFATDHHRIQVDADTVLPSMDACVRAMNEPMVSHDCIGFYLLSRKVAEHVKVVQSGQGADEILAGYHWYPPMMDSTDALADYRKFFFDRSHEEYSRIVAERFRGEDHSSLFVENHFAAPGAETPIEKVLRLDTTVMLVDDPVKRVDSMTMAWSLEARVPFLDHEFVEFAAKIPPEMKVARGGKHILKEASRDIIPQEVIDRPKGYFPVPALKYIKGEYLEFVKEILTSDTARNRNMFRPEYVDRLMADPESHITPLNGSKLWQIALLEHWLQTNGL